MYSDLVLASYSSIRMKLIVNRSWFFLIEFTCIALAVIVWSNNPNLTGNHFIAIAPLLGSLSEKHHL
jgi:hypothetical protein